MKAIYLNNENAPQRSQHTVRFDPAVEESLDQIHAMLCSRWRLKDKPSLSLLLAGVVRQFAASVSGDPSALKGLMGEIRARGGAVGKRGSFKTDASDPAKLRALVDQVAKTEAVMEAQDILDRAAGRSSGEQ
jgi:hypothetical protein